MILHSSEIKIRQIQLNQFRLRVCIHINQFNAKFVWKQTVLKNI